jgi:beta-lactamase class C
VTTAVTGSKWDMVSRETSAQVAGKMMEALYEQNGYVIESLLSTQFDNQRISKDIPVPVAHKIGDADDVKHDVAIVYAESPFLFYPSLRINQAMMRLLKSQMIFMVY